MHPVKTSIHPCVYVPDNVQMRRYVANEPGRPVGRIRFGGCGCGAAFPGLHAHEELHEIGSFRRAYRSIRRVAPTLVMHLTVLLVCVQADELGQNIAGASCYSPEASVRMFSNMVEYKSSHAGMVTTFTTACEERENKAMERVRELQHAYALDSSCYTTQRLLRYM